MSLHFAGVPEYSPAHVMLMASVGKALRRRGHRFTLFQAAEVLSSIHCHEIDVCPLDTDGNGTRHERLAAHIGEQAGHLRFLCQTLPQKLSKAGADCILVDSMMPAGAVVGDALGIPFVTLSAGTPINSEPCVPPSFVPWGFRDSIAARLRNRFAYSVRDLFLRSALGVLNDFRARHNLRPYRCPEDSLSPLAQITPFVREFDFPRFRLPACFHYAGPFERTDPPSVLFPYERLNGKPIVYFACGTISEIQRDALSAAVVATRELGAQLVVSTGCTDVNGDLASATHVIQVKYAPQRALLQRAAVFITHAGLNSTLESLMAGVPLLAIPRLTFDHPGIAARIVYHGVGKTLDRRERIKPAAFRNALADLLENPRYRQRISTFQHVIRNAGGAELAASITEKVARTGQPVESL